MLIKFIYFLTHVNKFNVELFVLKDL